MKLNDSVIYSQIPLLFYDISWWYDNIQSQTVININMLFSIHIEFSVFHWHIFNISISFIHILYTMFKLWILEIKVDRGNLLYILRIEFAGLNLYFFKSIYCGVFPFFSPPSMDLNNFLDASSQVPNYDTMSGFQNTPGSPSRMRNNVYMFSPYYLAKCPKSSSYATDCQTMSVCNKPRWIHFYSRQIATSSRKNALFFLSPCHFWFSRDFVHS